MSSTTPSSSPADASLSSSLPGYQSPYPTSLSPGEGQGDLPVTAETPLTGELPHVSPEEAQELRDSENHTTHTQAEGEVHGSAPAHPWGHELRWGEQARDDVGTPAPTELADA